MITEISDSDAGVRQRRRAESAQRTTRAIGPIVGIVMSSANRQPAVRMLKALARAIVEELEYDGKPVDPAAVATRALHGYRHSPEDEDERAAVQRELEDYVRELRANPRD